MMSAVALILFFLMLLAYIQNIITGKDLQNTQGLLDDTRLALSLTQADVETAKSELNLITLDLDEAKILLSEQMGIIADQESLIADSEALLAEQKEKADEQELLLSEQKALIDEQAKYLVATNEEIESLRGQMQAIAVFRLSVLEQIKESIEGVMGSGETVSVGENGSIVLSEGILFDLGSSEIKPDSKPVLDRLARVFIDFLSDSENAKYVDSIVISGHTDSQGDAEYNRKLSTERANSVLNYMLTSGNGKLNNYSRFFCAAGYGATRPASDNSSDAGREANRRIEISIILKDETVLQIVENYLAIEPPVTE